MVSFFYDIVEFLNRQEIPYMLSGSMAMGVYTTARSTQDFDFIIRLDSKDVPELMERFREGYYCDEDAINDALRRKSMFNIMDYKTGFKADFMLLKDDEFRQTEFNRRIKMTLLGMDMYVVSGEDLLLSKLIWIQQLQSGRQMEDIKAISRFPSLDWDYIRFWIKRLNLHTFDLV